MLSYIIFFRLSNFFLVIILVQNVFEEKLWQYIKMMYVFLLHYYKVLDLYLKYIWQYNFINIFQHSPLYPLIDFDGYFLLAGCIIMLFCCRLPSAGCQLSDVNKVCSYNQIGAQPECHSLAHKNNPCTLLPLLPL